MNGDEIRAGEIFSNRFRTLSSVWDYDVFSRAVSGERREGHCRDRKGDTEARC